jgi:hypothetical protein
MKPADRRRIRDLARKAEERSRAPAPPPPPAAPKLHEMACLCGQLLRIREEDDEKRCTCPACRRKFEISFYDDPATKKKTLQPMYLDDGSVSGDTFTAETPSGGPPEKRGALDEAFGPPPPASLPFRCPCGRKLIARKEAYDKRVRCPDCGARMLVTLVYDPQKKAHSIQALRVTDAPTGDTWTAE